MKSQAQDNKQILLGLSIVILLLFGSYLLIAKVWNIFSSVDPRLGAGLVTAFAAVLVSLISVFISKYLDRKAAILTHLREKKIPTYEKIINFIFSLTFAEKLGKEKPSEKEMIKFMVEITQELVIWGSDEMLNAFYKFRTISIENVDNSNPKNPHNVLFMVEDLLLEIRKDLGHKNKNILRGKILGLFINDLPSKIKQA
ncbi:MAG: hypothetical protein KDJ22_00440 [Candidatus Competibacteraceae bacterium]|nr:hypothetical protein [Candidatus Competibacteraceae bacterium]